MDPKSKKAMENFLNAESVKMANATIHTIIVDKSISRKSLLTEEDDKLAIIFAKFPIYSGQLRYYKGNKKNAIFPRDLLKNFFNSILEEANK